MPTKNAATNNWNRSTPLYRRQSSVTMNTAPHSVMAIAPQNATTSAGMACPIWRVCNSRTAAATAEAAASTAQMLNSEGIGLMTRSAPVKPIAIAVQRRQPTASR